MVETYGDDHGQPKAYPGRLGRSQMCLLTDNPTAC
jgi:hypothetical protein